MSRMRTLAGAGGLVVLGWLAAQIVPLGMLTASQLPTASDDKPHIVAYVNGVPITRLELAEEMIARHGKPELEALINRKIIQQAAEKAGITVTETEMNEELREVMRLGSFRTAQEFETQFLKKEKGTTLFEFKEDVIRPGLVMKKIAGKKVEVTEEELRKLYESKYGPKVQCSIIMEESQKVALSNFAEIKGDPAKFREVARRQAQHRLAAGAGRIHPIGRNTTYKVVEDRAFEMKDGEISEVIQTKEGFIILMRESMVEPVKGKTFAEERDVLRVELVERKMRVEVPKLFKDIKDKAVVQNFIDQKFSNGLKETIERAQPGRK